MAPAALPSQSAVEKPTVITSFSAEDDLDKVWAEVIVRCNKSTKWDLNERNSLTIDQLVGKINPPKDGKSSSTQGKAKAVFKNALVCVQRFGSFAAQAGSMVFGPSQQCFNAINFIITAIQDYDAVFSNITALMERVSVFLEKLRIYLDDSTTETKLDKRLRLTVYRVLEQFITIMGTAHKLTHGWKGKLKLAAKIGAFGEDEGVKASMARLETLISDVTNTEITVIVKDLSEAARNIRGVDKKLDQIADAQEKTVASLGHLESAEQRRSADEEEKKRLAEIRDALGVDATKRPWSEKQDELWGKHIDGTGKWLLDFKFPSFPRWADPDETNVNVLGVRAAEGFGKSFLCSIVVNHLQEKHRDDPRIGMAYYYFQRDAFDKNPINKAMKAIIYQLASSSTSVGREYAKLVQKGCDRKADFGRTADLWKRLVTDISKSLDATFFIILDGIDEAEAESSKPLANIITQIMLPDKASQLKIRLFFTGRPSGLDGLREDMDPVPPEIKIAPQGGEAPSLNEEDIHIYTEERLSSMDIFKSENEEVSDLKARAKKELGSGVRGDYFALDYKLDSVSKSRNIREVEDILKLAKESRTQAIAREIDQLNENLRRDEIQEVNHMLTWASVCFNDLHVKQYEAMLLLKAETKSLISLEKQICDRYSSLFDIDESKIVTLRSDDIRGYLKDKDEMTSSRDGLSHGRTDIIPFYEGEINLVKRLLRTHFNTIFGADDLYEKFAFDEFFESKLGSQAIRIRMNSQDDNHVRVAQACLVAVCDHFEEPDYSELHPYAWEWFADHLNQVGDTADIDAATKQDIGRKLVRVLRDTPLIDVWWDETRLRNISKYWVYETFCARPVYKWLRDPVVQKGLMDMPSERQWVIANTSEEEGPWPRILENVAKRLAKHWFAMKDGMWYLAFVFIHGYLSNLRGEQPDWNEEPSVEETARVETWAKEVLANGDQEAKWHACLAETLSRAECLGESIVRYREALKSDHQDWKLHIGLAEALRGNKESQEAVKELEGLIQDNQERVTSDDDDDYKTAYWESILLLLGGSYMDVKDYNQAEGTYRKVLDEGLTRDSFLGFAKRAVYMMTEAFAEQQRHNEIMSLLDELNNRQDEVDGIGTWLNVLFHHYADWGELHDRICTAANGVSQHNATIQKYQGAIEAARAESSRIGIFLYLRHQLASLLWTRPSREERESALDIWEEIIKTELPEGVDDDADMVGSAHALVATKLAPSLLDSAKENGLSTPLSPKAESYAQRLEKLTHIYDETLSSRVEYRNVRLSLARFHHLAGDDARAKDILREYMKTCWQQAEGEVGFRDGMYKISGVLQALDDDVNVLAAWSLYPDVVPAENIASDGSQSEAEGPEKISASAKAEGETEQAEPNAKKDETETPEALDDKTLPNGMAEQEVQAPSGPSVEESTNEPTEPETKDSWAGACDGCGISWTRTDKLWACKDCLDVQLEANCFEKLQNGTLNPKICSKRHSHVVISLFDRERRQNTPEGQMWVGGKLMTRMEWKESVKKNWGIDEKTLSAKERLVESVKTIQRTWRATKPAVKA